MKNRNELEIEADNMRMDTAKANDIFNGIGEKDIKRILVPVDFSDASVYICLKGGEMAKLFKSELYLIHVVENKDTHFMVVPESKESFSISTPGYGIS